MITLDSTLDLSAFEFAKKCEHPPCENEAEYSVWTAHGAKRCPVVMLRCGDCLERLKTYWEMEVMLGLTCGRCGTPPPRQLSDVVKAIKL
jgi:hypothetical protein